MKKDILFKSLDYVLLITIFFVFGYSIVSYPVSYNEDIFKQQQYLLLLISFPVIISLCIKLLYNVTEQSLTAYLSFFSLIFLEVLLIINPGQYNFQNEHFSVFICLIIYFLVFQSVSVKYLKTFGYAICLIFLFELGYFFWQVSLYHDDPNREILLTGTLQYSGVFAVYSVAHLPLVIYALRTHISDQRLKYLFLSMAYIIILYVIFLTRSRTAFITLIPITIGSNYIFIKGFLANYSSRIKLFFLFITLLIFTISLYSLFSIKYLSGVGRFMMSHVTLSSFDEYVYWGIGYGNLPLKYPYWQAAFFTRNLESLPTSYFLSAGKSTLIYNDFLQLFVEVGGIIFLFFIYLCSTIFRLETLSSLKLISGAFKMIVLGILVSSFSSVTFHIIPLMILLLLAFAMLSHFNKEANLILLTFPKSKVIFKIMLVLLIFVSCITYYQVIRQAQTISTINSLSQDYTISDREKLQHFEDSYKLLKYNGKFLTIYGQFLYQLDNQSKTSIRLLERGQNLFFKYDLVENLAQAYKNQGNYPKAIEKYELLSNYVPSLFRPKIELAKLYASAGAKNRASELARQILNMPVKKPSREVEDIKHVARTLID